MIETCTGRTTADCLLHINSHIVSSNLSFFRSIFKRLLLQTRKNQGLFWERVDNCSLRANRGYFSCYESESNVFEALSYSHKIMDKKAENYSLFILFPSNKF